VYLLVIQLLLPKPYFFHCLAHCMRNLTMRAASLLRNRFSLGSLATACRFLKRLNIVCCLVIWALKAALFIFVVLNTMLVVPSFNSSICPIHYRGLRTSSVSDGVRLT